MNKTIRVMIVDDHHIVAEGLRFIVSAQPDMEFVGSGANGIEAVQRVRELKPDVVLMDFTMPALNGVEATRQIVARHPNCRIVVLSVHADGGYVRRAFDAGASAYLVKRTASHELIEAIRAAHAGKRYLSAELAVSMIDEYANGNGVAAQPLQSLSAREREVLQLLAEGASVVEIGRRLSLSPRTVETYRARMMQKLGIDSIAALVKFAIQHGVIGIE